MAMLIEADALPTQRWRNGAGLTRELFVWPPAADWRLRLSLADIDADGPFSAFAGVQRQFAVIEGDGVALRLADGEHALRAGEAPLCFDGAQAPHCRLLGGPTRDLNLMLRGVAGAMRIAAPGWSAPASAWRALFSASGGLLRSGDGASWTLPARALLVDLPATPLHWQGSGPAYWIDVAR